MTKKKVAVALSGGEDSSIAALLLKKEGYEVLGIYMSLSDAPCSQPQLCQAERVCRSLDIPFHVVDLRREFERGVIDYFSQEYQRGRTPNPCVACNRHIKFGCLLSQALSLGVQYLATGHYARIEHRDGRYHLLEGIDAAKDQSYFLYTLTQEKLGHILFPLGGYQKTEVRRIAQQEGLPAIGKPSQDICFVSQKNYRDFLQQRFGNTAGDIVDRKGKILGRHQGVAFYTVGQRHGLGVASGKPLYVLEIILEDNRIILGEGGELYHRQIAASNLTWVAGAAPSEPAGITARIRYQSPQAEAVLFPQGDLATVFFSEPQWAVAPGQAVVFYNGEEVLGGGIIENMKS
ncbi:MAG: tRNA 2-thiouridine(34) synthase MnmA [Chloroflexota bacterium]|nr:tRNA 2-thiouridine(34) synthase MnmA [Chloroflexota bacterium]